MRSITVTLGLLLIALCHPSFAENAAVAAEAAGAAGGAETVVRVAEGAPLAVECALRVEERAQWRRDGAAPPADMRAAPEAPAPGGGLTARLWAPAARAAHAGLYTCSRAPRARVRVLVLPAASAPEPGAASAPTAAPTPDAADGDSDLVMYQLYHPFELSCAPPDNVDATGITFSWLANGTALDASALKGRYKLAGGGSALQVERALEEDYGNYSCLVGGAAARRWRVHARPVLRLAPDHNVVEGQKLKVTCRVLGKPYPEVEWWFRAAGSPDNATALPLEGRVSAQPSAAGVPAGELLLAAAEAADAGEYSCRAPGAQPATTTVRVKDMYAALWPFLGICAEVFILCAIILVYEKRRTKPELDDSDTDHEQKKS